MNLYSKKAIKILNNGGVAIFPTDTAFGIGCRLDYEDAVKRVFDIRNRPHTQPTPVLFSSLKMLKEYVLDIPNDVLDLAAKHWPGALTIILPAEIEKVPSLVRGGGLTIGVRIPDHKELLQIISDLNVPILGPSANFHGEKTPFEMADLDPKLCTLVDYVLPGKCITKKESTVIDCTSFPWKIIRQGALEVENLS